MTVKSPAWMFDGDVEYELNIGLDITRHHNIALIIDNSLSMNKIETVERPVLDDAGLPVVIDDEIVTESVDLSLLEIAKKAFKHVKASG